MAELLTTKEALTILRYDADTTDTAILNLVAINLNGVSSYLTLATGKDWTTDTTTEPLAKQAAKFLLELWYNPDPSTIKGIQNCIDSLLTALQGKAKEDET